MHGLWMTPRSWEQWIERYSSRGYRVLAPAWPGLEGEVEQLRRDPSPLKRVDAKHIVDQYERIIRGLERPPIVMGHSNTLTEEEALLAFDRYAIPAASRVLFQGTLANINPRTPFRVNFRKDDRALLLFIGGGVDHVVPAKVSRKIARKYRNSKAITE